MVRRGGGPWKKSRTLRLYVDILGTLGVTTRWRRYLRRATGRRLGLRRNPRRTSPVGDCNRARGVCPRSHFWHGKLAGARAPSIPQLPGAGRKNGETHGGSQCDMHIDCASPSSARRPADGARRASSPIADASCHPQPVTRRAPRRLRPPKGRAPLTPCPMALDWWEPTLRTWTWPFPRPVTRRWNLSSHQR